MDLTLKRCLNSVLLCFLFFWPIVDTVNGALYYQNESFPSVSAFYKGVGFIGITILLIVYHFYRFLQLLIFISLSMVCIFYQFIFYGSVGESVVWATRGLLTLALLLYLISDSRSNDFWGGRKVVSLMLFYFIVMSINVLLGVLGIGESQYAGGIGGKGYIIAGNEMSYLMLVSASVVLIYVASKERFLTLFLVFLVMLSFFFMKATKVAMLGICISYVLALIYYGYFKVVHIPTIYALGGVGSIALVYVAYSFLQTSGMLDRMLFLYDLHGGVWGALLSGRVSFVQEAYNSILVEFGFWDVFFGIGVDQQRAIAGSIVEIDLIDVFIAFGVVGPMIFYFPWVLGIFWSISLLFKQPRFGLCFMLLVLMLVGVSLTAGHVVNSGIASSATAFFISYLYMLKEKQKLYKEI